MATDGLWEFVSDREAIELAAGCKDPQQAVDTLIREANDRWMREEQVGYKLGVEVGDVAGGLHTCDTSAP